MNTASDAASMGLMNCPQVASLYRLQWEEVQQAWVLLYPEGMVKLNGSAGEIMRRLNGQTTVQAVIESIELEFGMAGLKEDVQDFLAMARLQGWVRL